MNRYYNHTYGNSSRDQEFELIPEFELMLENDPEFEKAKPPRYTRPTVAPSLKACDNEKLITVKFWDFMKQVEGLVRKMKLSACHLQGILNLLGELKHKEIDFQKERFAIFTCSKINNPLLLYGETADAEIDIAGKKLRFTETAWNLTDEFLKNQDLEVLTRFLKKFAHEKRHATLGSAVVVTTAALQKGLSSSEATQAQYRVTEILVVAEEIAVSKRMDPSFTVTLVVQSHIHKLWMVVTRLVTNAEKIRLRNLIIKLLRDRYGFVKGCDNPITLGVLSCIDHSKWHVISSGKILTPLPAGLKFCNNVSVSRCGTI